VDRDVLPARRTTRPDPCGVATGRFDLATCFGASTVMLGSGAAEPVAVCDTAVPLKLQSNEIDKIAIAEGAKRLDEDLMTLSFQIQDDYAVLVPYRGATLPLPSHFVQRGG